MDAVILIIFLFVFLLFGEHNPIKLTLKKIPYLTKVSHVSAAKIKD